MLVELAKSETISSVGDFLTKLECLRSVDVDTNFDDDDVVLRRRRDGDAVHHHVRSAPRKIYASPFISNFASGTRRRDNAESRSH